MITYPSWICSPCGERYGRVVPRHISTFHTPDPEDEDDKCGWCGARDRSLTEPRDYGHPEAPK